MSTTGGPDTDLLAANRLSSLIPACLRYLLTIATRHRPRHLLRLLNSFDEIYALLACIVQHHYLSTTQASFLEHCHGLIRHRPIAARTHLKTSPLLHEALRLRSRDRRRSLIILVLLPYLRRKLDEHFDRRSRLGSEYYRRFLQWYPTLRTSCHAAGLAFSLAYLSGHTEYASPLLWLARVQLRRATSADSKRPHSRNVFAQALQNLQIALPSGVLVLHFLEWWQTSDISRQFKKVVIPHLPAPRVASGTPVSPAGLPIFTVPLTESSLCAICLHPYQTPTAAPTGHVFCYTCIFKWIQGLHERQESFMNGAVQPWTDKPTIIRQGAWDSGKGRCAITGRKLLGGTASLRRLRV